MIFGLRDVLQIRQDLYILSICVSECMTFQLSILVEVLVSVWKSKFSGAMCSWFRVVSSLLVLLGSDFLSFKMYCIRDYCLEVWGLSTFLLLIYEVLTRSWNGWWSILSCLSRQCWGPILFWKLLLEGSFILEYSSKSSLHSVKMHFTVYDFPHEQFGGGSCFSMKELI